MREININIKLVAPFSSIRYGKRKDVTVRQAWNAALKDPGIWLLFIIDFAMIASSIEIYLN